MANTGVRGRVVDNGNVGIPGLVVAAYDVEVIADDVLLRNTATAADPVFPGLARTDANGDYVIAYPAGAYGLESKPDIKIRVYDTVKRLLAESNVHEDVSAAELAVPPITISRADVEGLLVTLGTGSPDRLTAGNSIEFLIDNEEAWGRLTDSIAVANGELRFLLLLWDVEGEFLSAAKLGLITKFAAGHPVVGSATQGTVLESEVVQLNVNGLAVRMVMWDWPPIITPSFSSQASKFFTQSGTIEFREFSSPWFTTMHAKSVIVPTASGSMGFLIASPFLQEYFDRPAHSIDEPRRGEFGWLKSQIKIPIHDVSAQIQGPALADIDRTFRLHWDKLSSGGSTPLPPVAAPSAQPANVSLQLVRSLPGDVFANPAAGETGILEAYLRAIKHAQDFIYMENQYFTVPVIGEALMFALKQNTNLNVILLINNKLDLPLYGGWQTGVIKGLLNGLSAGERARLGIFTLWSHEAGVPKSRIVRNYVHSKLAIVDDEWATVGSANLDGASLDSAQHYLFLDELFLGLIPNYKVRVRRASELNALVFNGVEGQPSTDVIRILRRRLFSEHLGVPTGQVDVQGAQRWLQIWNVRADEKLTALKADPPAVHACRVLRFPHTNGAVPDGLDDPIEYLKALGANVTKLQVLEHVKEFRFQTGRWL